MPRLNGTGPNGSGPMTGRGLGRCKDGLQDENGITSRNITMSNDELNRFNSRGNGLYGNGLRRSDMQSSGMRRCGKGSGNRRRQKGN